MKSEQTKKLRQLADLDFKFKTKTDKKCLQSAYTEMECMVGMESLPFPDEIVLKILGYLSFGQLIQCARVSKRWKNICEDRSLSYRSSMLVMKKLNCSKQNWVSSVCCKNSTSSLCLFRLLHILPQNNICKDCTLSYRSNMLEMKDLTAKDRKTIIDILIDRPEVTRVMMSSKKTQQHLVLGKAPLHVMIFQNRLYFRWKPFDLRLYRGYTFSFMN